jgi:hypothetical protein
MDRGRDPMVGEKNICECDSRLLLGVLYIILCNCLIEEGQTAKSKMTKGQTKINKTYT